MVGWIVGLLVGWLVGLLVGWLVGRSFGWVSASVFYLILFGLFVLVVMCSFVRAFVFPCGCLLLLSCCCCFSPDRLMVTCSLDLVARLRACLVVFFRGCVRVGPFTLLGAGGRFASEIHTHLPRTTTLTFFFVLAACAVASLRGGAFCLRLPL